MSAEQSVLGILLRAAGAGATAAAGVLPGDASIASRVIGELLGAGAELLDLGVDPVRSLRRVAERAPARQQTLEAWEAAIRKRYGAPRDPYED